MAIAKPTRKPSKRTAAVQSDDDVDATTLATAANSDDDIELDPIEVALVSDYQNQQQPHSDNDDDDDTADTAATAKPKRRVTDPLPLVNNLSGLRESINDIRLPSDWPWEESLSMTSVEPLAVQDVHNDLERESAFYALTINGVVNGLAKLTELGTPTRRPDDYFCEMIKPDVHMQRIRARLVAERQRISAVAERKASAEQRKFSKQVQSEKVKEKSQVKKRAREGAEQYSAISKQRDDLKIERSTLPAIDAQLKASRQNPDAPGGPRLSKRARLENGKGGEALGLKKMSHKRESKNERYGFGGKKRGSKRNDAESAGDMSSFSSKSNLKGFGGGQKFGGRSFTGKGKQNEHGKGGDRKRSKHGSGAARMGKSARQKTRK